MTEPVIARWESLFLIQGVSLLFIPGSCSCLSSLNRDRDSVTFMGEKIPEEWKWKKAGELWATLRREGMEEWVEYRSSMRGRCTCLARYNISNGREDGPQERKLTCLVTSPPPIINEQPSWRVNPSMVLSCITMTHTWRDQRHISSPERFQLNLQVVGENPESFRM